MEVGINSFAAVADNAISTAETRTKSIAELLERIEEADRVGLDVFGIGEHHRKEFLDSAPTIILAAAAARTKKIRLTSAVTVLSAADPVRVFQNFATLDLVSEKLDLLLTIRDNEIVNWSGNFRPPLINQAIYPRPMQDPLPIWVGVGGTPQSFIRAGVLGLPLMVAIIGGETRQFRPLVDLYREAGRQAGHPPEKLTIGLHSLGYVGNTTQEVIDDYYPGYAEVMTKIGKERGWPPMRRERFDALMGPLGSLLVGSPEEVAAKILRHSAALGGISRVTFQMDNAGLTHEKLMQSIDLIGKQVAPIVNGSK